MWFVLSADAGLFFNASHGPLAMIFLPTLVCIVHTDSPQLDEAVLCIFILVTTRINVRALLTVLGEIENGLQCSLFRDGTG